MVYAQISIFTIEHKKHIFNKKKDAMAQKWFSFVAIDKLPDI